MSSINACIAILCAAFLVACSKGKTDEVVVYVSVDRAIAEPLLRRFEEEHGTRVLAVYDTEANKTTGLVNRLLAESKRPRADVFWSGEIAQTLRLSAAGVLASHRPVAPAAKRTPRFSATDGTWHAFAARPRVLLLNESVLPGKEPPTVESLSDIQWQGRVAIADPHFGTTGSHLAALYTLWGEERFRAWAAAMRKNAVRILPGNAQVRDAVVAGIAGVGLTDSDDAADAQARGAQVRIVLLPQSAEHGVVMIPGTVARIAGAPNEAQARVLLDYLLSEEAEALLVHRASVFFPVGEGVGTEINRRLVSLSEPDNYENLGSAYARMLKIIESEWFPDSRNGT